MVDDRIVISQRFEIPDGWKPYPTDAFDVKLEGRWLWIKKALWSALKKFGCVSAHWDREMLVRSVVVDPQRVTSLVLMEAKGQFLQMYRTTPVDVYIGMDDLADFLSEDLQRMGSFSFEYSARIARGETPELLRMRVHAIPHMKGILLV